ncbi:MAG: hypothetical protein CMG00_02505 [Candidatus Marinimicrobia bacterium]|nr:hypothetical protein [Candidatus Neomarinimicrobiota bacterium]
MKKYIYILLAGLSFLIGSNISSDYNQFKNFRAIEDYDESLKMLFKIKNDTLVANYNIAEIYLNEYSNYTIALDYFSIILDSLDRVSENKNENLELYKKSLFMSSYICSNYLGMYTKGFNGYNSFLEQFPNDELSESAKYELEILNSFEQSKNNLLKK